MASSRPLDETKTPSLDLSKPEIHSLPAYRRLAVLNGFLIGLAISTGFWALKVYSISTLPVAMEIEVGSVLGSSLLIIVLSVIISWVSGSLNIIWLTIPLWLVGGSLITVLLGYIPAYGRNVAIWLADDRFANVTVYAVPQRNEWWSFVIAGLLLIFILFILAVLQAVRLERAFNELNPGGNVSARAFFILLLPALFAGFGALTMPDHLGNGPRGALIMTQKGIQTVQDFEGDAGELFNLSRETGFNYSALNSVRDGLDGSYTLMIGEVDADASQVSVIAHFENGAWVNCRVNAFAGQATYLSFCADASRPYTEGFASLITGRPLPENCFGCLPQAEVEWQTWLRERAPQFGEAIQFERLGQQGNAVWMRASAPVGNYAVDCLFTGIADVQLQECTEVAQ